MASKLSFNMNDGVAADADADNLVKNGVALVAVERRDDAWLLLDGPVDDGVRLVVELLRRYILI